MSGARNDPRDLRRILIERFKLARDEDTGGYSTFHTSCEKIRLAKASCKATRYKVLIYSLSLSLCSACGGKFEFLISSLWYWSGKQIYTNFDFQN